MQTKSPLFFVILSIRWWLLTYWKFSNHKNCQNSYHFTNRTFHEMGARFHKPHQACWIIYSVQINSSSYKLCYQMDRRKNILDQHNDNHQKNSFMKSYLLGLDAHLLWWVIKGCILSMKQYKSLPFIFR
jgi:hypothetical protein